MHPRQYSIAIADIDILLIEIFSQEASKTPRISIQNIKIQTMRALTLLSHAVLVFVVFAFRVVLFDETRYMGTRKNIVCCQLLLSPSPCNLGSYLIPYFSFFFFFLAMKIRLLMRNTKMLSHPSKQAKALLSHGQGASITS